MGDREKLTTGRLGPGFAFASGCPKLSGLSYYIKKVLFETGAVRVG